MADIVAQILIDGSDIFSTDEEEVEKLKEQGVVSYTYQNWELSRFHTLMATAKRKIFNILSSSIHFSGTSCV